jgi:hypothetical protein
MTAVAERKPCRPKADDAPRWESYIADPQTHPAMRRIALGALHRNFSIAQFAALADRDDSNVLRSLRATRPQPKTLDVYARALGLPATARRALTDEMNARDVAAVVRIVVSAGGAAAVEISNVSDYSRGELGNAERVDLKAAARAYVFAANRLDDQRDPVMAFRSVLNPQAQPEQYLVGGEFSERALEEAESLRQATPAMASFTPNEMRPVYEWFESFFAMADDPAGAPHTVPIEELAGLKDALGHEAGKHAGGEPLPRYIKKR